MADDLGYECLGCYGGESYLTPNLDSLAETGIRFDHCYSQPLCTPSRVQIMTGRYNFRNYKMFGYLDLSELTFGHVFKKAGYQTCIAGKWQLGNGIEGPFHAGFDEYCLWQIYSKIAGKDVRGSRYANPRIYKNGQIMDTSKADYGPDIFCNYLLEFIEQHQSSPFFIYYPMVLTHDPFVPTPDSKDWGINKNKKNIQYFQDMVHYMDKQVGRIVKKLDELGIRKDTLIIFTADNGTSRHIRSKRNGNWIQGGKSLMTDSGTHVPLIANWSGTIPSGQSSDNLIDFTDFMPTFADVAGTHLPEESRFDGISFYPTLVGDEGPIRKWVFMYYWGRGRNIMKTRRCARNKRYKLYDNGDLYDLLNDPLEEYPMASKESKELHMVKRRLQEVLDTMK
jgi:arylsulfatase A-like enzyme